MDKCKKHPKYKGILKPFVECNACQKIYNENHNIVAKDQITKIKAIIEKRELYSDEQMFQSDRVSIDAVEILVEICEVVGYAKYPYDDEDGEDE
jgi:hypothetical protein